MRPRNAPCRHEHCGSAVAAPAAQVLRRHRPPGPFTTAPPRPAFAALPALLTADSALPCPAIQANYRDPKTGLNFYSAEVYAAVKDMPPARVQQFLTLRGAAVKLG